MLIGFYKKLIKNNIFERIVVFAICMSLLAGCGTTNDQESFHLEENKGQNATSYPYVVHTDSATWYLSKADMEMIGEDAYLEGFRKIIENQESDFADAQKALQGYLNKEIPPVNIFTDFCGKAEESRFHGGYYYGDARGIRLFTDWIAAEAVLLHEYVHYLSSNCAESPVSDGFWAEALADYVSNLACENRMARTVNYGVSGEELQFYLDRGAVDPDTGQFDIRRYTCGTAEIMNSDAMLGQTYLSVAGTISVISEQRREFRMITDLSYYEAASMMEYLIENFGRDTVFSHWNIDGRDMKDVYGKSFTELYDDWRAWNLARCNEYGLDLTIAGFK